MKLKSVLIFLLLIVLLFISASAEVIKIKINGNIIQMKVYKGYYYFYDKSLGSVYQYNTEYKFIQSFGKFGEGPGELTEVLGYDFINNKIYLQSQTKIVFFDLNGKQIDEKRKVRPSYFKILRPDLMVELFTEFNSENSPRFNVEKIYTCDEKFNRLECIFSDSELKHQGSPFKDFINKIEVKVSDQTGKFLVSQRRKGFLFHVFNGYGKKIQEIKNMKITQLIVTQKFLKDFKEKLFSDPRMRSNQKMAEHLFKQIRFSKYFPPFHSFYSDDQGNIFVRTFQRKDDLLLYKFFSKEGKFVKDYWLKDENSDIYETRNFISFYNNTFIYLEEMEDGEYVLVKQKLI